MTSQLSYKEVFQTLREGTARQLTSSAQVQALVKAAQNLDTVYRSHLQTPWDAAKLLSSALRHQIDAQCLPADPGEVRLSLNDLYTLLSAAFRVCPLPSLSLPLSDFNGDTSHHGHHPLHQLACPVLNELQKLNSCILDDNREMETEAALQVLLSLIQSRHRLSGLYNGTDVFLEESADAEQFFLKVTQSLVQPTALVRYFGPLWLQNLLQYPMRSRDPATCLAVLGFLEASLLHTAPTILSALETAFKDSGCPATPLSVSWDLLQQHLCQLTLEELHQFQARYQESWKTSVVPLLATALTSEPLLYSPSCTDPLRLSEPLEESLDVLITSSSLSKEAAELPVLSRSAVTAPALESLLLLSRLQCYSAVRALMSSSVLKRETWSRYLEPVVAVCLRWGRLDAAVQLLSWAEPVLEKAEKQWCRRLQARQGGVDLCRPLLTSLWVDRDTSGACMPVKTYSDFLQAWRSTSSLDCSVALDVLTTCNEVDVLRLVCDGLLRCRGEWSRQVLQDRFALYYVFHALSRLVDASVDVGDIPIARYFLTSLGRLLLSCPCPIYTTRYLQSLHRLASAMSCYRLSSTGYDDENSPRGRAVTGWARIARHLSRRLTIPSVTHSLHSAFAVRRRYYSKLLSMTEMKIDDAATPIVSSAASNRTPSYTAVELLHQYGAATTTTTTTACSTESQCGRLVVRRLRCSKDDAKDPAVSTSMQDSRSVCSAEGPPCKWEVSIDAELMLSTTVEKMKTILRGNREQLRRGSGKSATRSAVKCDEAMGTNGDRVTTDALSEKEEWWARRFQLDASIKAVGQMLQQLLGVSRFLLLGDPPSSLCSQLWQITCDFAERCSKHMSDYKLKPPLLLRESCCIILQGLPFLASGEAAVSGASGDDVCDAFSDREQRGCWYAPASVHASSQSHCPKCSATIRQVQHMLLESLVTLGLQLAPPQEGQLDEMVLWADFVAESVIQREVEDLVNDAMDLYYAALSPSLLQRHCTAQPLMDSSIHVDLCKMPREHVYLIVSGELHTLPWESMELLCQASLSRVPHAAYPREILQQLQSPFLSVERLLLHRDVEALQGPSIYDELLADHPKWTAEYSKTQSTGPPSHGVAPSRLLSRLLHHGSTDEEIDTYVYAGHRGGEHLISRGSLYEAIPGIPLPRTPLALLMGCSTARMQGNQKMESYGLPFAYLTAGIPCMVGCLWDVTDRDIDRFAWALLRWAAKAAAGNPAGSEAVAIETNLYSGLTIGECIAAARLTCRLRYLTAFAAVFYGVNLPLQAKDEEPTSEMEKPAAAVDPLA